MKLLKKIQNESISNEPFCHGNYVYAANTRCAWIGHQPKMPEDVRNFKRM